MTIANISKTRRGRQKKVRYIQRMPKIAQFSPRGKTGRPDEAELKLDEFEALKLADYQGYHQDEGAQAMGVSRASFGRILRNARKIVADAIVNGKMIRIRTGDAQVGVRRKDLELKRAKIANIQDPQKQEEIIRQTILNYTTKPGKQNETLKQRNIINEIQEIISKTAQ